MEVSSKVIPSGECLSYKMKVVINRSGVEMRPSVARLGLLIIGIKFGGDTFELRHVVGADASYDGPCDLARFDVPHIQDD